MDRPLTDKEKNHDRRKRLLKGVIPVAVIAGAIVAGIIFSQPTVERTRLKIVTAQRDNLETTLRASGKVVPAFEEIIVAPISSRIMEIYANAGDRLEEGTPLMRLDLQDAETETNRLRDNSARQANTVERTRLTNRTELTNLEMQIRVKEMNVSQLRAEADNERRLDSIGSGTGDAVRRAELAWRTACIELDQLRSRLANERQALDASLRNEQLSLDIARRDLAMQMRTLDDARLRSPRAATLTYILNNVGQQVTQGERLAVIADLSHFKIDAEISEDRAGDLAAGGRAKVRTGNRVIEGTIVNITPTSTQGAVKFSVIPADSADMRLRPGLTADVHVVTEVLPDATVIPMGAYYANGPGEYKMYVETTPGVLQLRTLQLGKSNMDYVEVVSGLSPGEQVVISGLSDTKKAKYNVK